MNIPQGFLELGISAIIAFVFKVVFGLINKNEVKSDVEDLRLHAEISSVRKEAKEREDRFRSNDITIFEKISEIRASVARLEAIEEKHD